MDNNQNTKIEFEYNFHDKKITDMKNKAIAICDRFNATIQNDYESQRKIIKEMFGATGKYIYIRPRFYCDNGKNIYVGENFITNQNVTILDVAPVYIGDYVIIGPNTIITTVNHPHSPAKRRQHIMKAQSIKIGNDVCIGGNSVILPGVTIGNNVIIGAGSVVADDIPDNCMVMGVPAQKIQDLENDL